MTNPAVGEILNELLALEQRSIVSRLVESNVFVARTAVEELFALRRLAQWNREHCQKLSQLILDLGGLPGPRGYESSSADLHYLGLRHVLPRIEADLQQIIRRYQLATMRMSGDTPAFKLIQEILQHHEESLRIIQGLGSRRVAVANPIPQS